MATTSLWAVRGTIRDVVAYVKDPNKTANPDYDLKNVIGIGGLVGVFDVSHHVAYRTSYRP